MNQTVIPRVILVVEEDRIGREELSYQLREEGYLVLAVADGMMALDITRTNPLSLIVLDAALLPVGGLDLCRKIRSYPEIARLPILLAVTDATEIPVLRRSGVPVNDYIVKPFLWEELHACVRTLLRYGKRKEYHRAVKGSLKPIMEREREEEPLLTAEDLCIDVARHKVFRHGQPIEIRSALLFKLLVYMVRHRGIVFTQNQLLTHVWGYADAEVIDATTRTVSVHVHWLRELLGDTPDHPQLIETVRGVGYRFKD
jgi:DNA-binding response OmpR family regulator